MIVEICFVNHMRGHPMLWDIFFGGQSMQWNVRGLAEEKLFFLAIAKEIVRLHGGTITAGSENEMTTFCEKLPAE